MYTTVPMEAVFFLASIAAGGVSAFVFDLFRISRRLMHPSDLAVSAQDILFPAIAAIILFQAAYLKNSGEIRWHGFIGFGLGLFLYAVTVRNRFLNVSIKIVRWVTGAALWLLRIVIFPLKLLMKIFRRPVRIIVWHTGKNMRRIKYIARRWIGKKAFQWKKIGFLLRKK